MTLIFCDIDGVLATTYAWGKRPLAQALEKPRVRRISNLCTETGATLVVTSTWRLAMLLSELRESLISAGLAPSVMVDITPPILEEKRAVEIQTYLGECGGARFVVFDDDQDAHIQGRFVWIARSLGLEDHHITRAKQILQQQQDDDPAMVLHG